jgi:hypothetical protein
MKKPVVVLVLSACPIMAWAQALNLMPISAQIIETRAKPLAEAAAKVTDATVKCVADERKITGLYAPGPVAVFLMGDKKLSEDAIRKAGKEPVPVGVLFFINLSLTSNGQPLAADKLRTVTVKGQQGDDRRLSLIHLAVVNEGGQHKLQLYAKGKQPVLDVLLNAASRDAAVDLESKPAEKGAILTLTLAGKFQATLPVIPQTW